MKKLEERVDEGWMVHIYGRNRRLLCALEPSHGWSFVIGFGVGLALTIALFNLFHLSSPRPTTHSSHTVESPVNPMLNID